jgi:hypothetical protein
MTYSCKHCNFKWDAWEGNIQKVLDHEKTHLKKPKIPAGRKVEQ